MEIFSTKYNRDLKELQELSLKNSIELEGVQKAKKIQLDKIDYDSSDSIDSSNTYSGFGRINPLVKTLLILALVGIVVAFVVWLINEKKKAEEEEEFNSELDELTEAILRGKYDDELFEQLLELHARFPELLSESRAGWIIGSAFYCREEELIENGERIKRIMSHLYSLLISRLRLRKVVVKLSNSFKVFNKSLDDEDLVSVCS